MKRIIVPVLVLAVLGAAGFGLYRRLNAEDPNSEVQYKLAEATVGTVKKTVTATGSLKPWAVVDIKSKAGGRVNEMRVDVGDVVKKDQILARIDPADTLLSVQQAAADRDSAAAKETQSDRQWRLQLQSTQSSIATAAASLQSARANLSSAQTQLEKARSIAKYQPRSWDASVASSRASLESAQKALQELKATNAADLAAAQASVDQARANHANAEAGYKRQVTLMARGFVAQQAVDTAKASNEVAASQVRSAESRLHSIAPQQAAALAAAQARVNQARSQVDSAVAQEVDVVSAKQAVAISTASVEQAKAQVAQAQAAYDQSRANAATNEIRKLDIASARAGIARAKASLINATNTLDQTTVRSPSEGVILQKYVEQGTIISSALSFAATGNSIFQLGDITRMYVDVAVDETDVASIRDQMPVEVTFDAFPSVTFDGKVIRVDPDAKVEQNVTTVHVRVEVDNTAPAYQLLKPGLNATCEFVDQKKENVLTVPTEAVHTGDSEEKYVEVATGGRPAPPDPKTGSPAEPGTLVRVKVERRTVQVPLEGNETAEVATGLKAGEKVVIKKIEPVKQTATSPFAGGGMRGPGMGGGGRGR